LFLSNASCAASPTLDKIKSSGAVTMGVELVISHDKPLI